LRARARACAARWRCAAPWLVEAYATWMKALCRICLSTLLR
jgi:hypothetical protein